jgi:UDP-N-acetylmuramate-alanine ligase
MDLQDIRSVYFLGIGGIGMSALARWFVLQGATVAGYDRTPTPLTDELAAEGMNIHFEEDLRAVPKKTDLVVLHEGDPSLRNPYGVIAVNPKRHPTAKYDLARKFIEFVTGREGQRIIANFRIGGDPLFFPSAPGGK